jgi:hypothetical protein
MQPMNSPSDIAMNMPNASMMYSTFTPTFGNLSFQLAPSQTGEVNLSNGVMPYMSLEGLIYMQQVQAATNQTNTQGSQMTGQQNIQGALTFTDATGNLRMVASGGGQAQTSLTGGF